MTRPVGERGKTLESNGELVNPPCTSHGASLWNYQRHAGASGEQVGPTVPAGDGDVGRGGSGGASPTPGSGSPQCL